MAQAKGVLPENARWLTLSAYGGMFVFGVVIAILGSILPVLLSEIQLAPQQAGSLFLFLNLGSFAVSIGGGPAFDRVGYRLILAGCALLSAAAIIVMANGTSWSTLALASCLLGMGGGGLNVGTNALVSDLHPDNQSVALNKLGIFFGIGTCFIPFLVGMLLERLGLAGVLYLTAAVAAAPGLGFVLLQFPSSKHSAGLPMGEVLGLLKNPYILLLGLLLFFQSGNEITTGGWMTTFLVGRLDLSPASAAFYLAAFWMAVVAGRIVASSILRFWAADCLIRWGALAAAAASLAFAILPGTGTSFLWAALLGFAMSPIFPTVLGQACARFPSFSGTVMGTLMAGALIGGMVIPWGAGFVVQQIGLDWVMLIPAAGFLVVFLIQSHLRRPASRGIMIS